ncbi:MAG TPA: hypothetical protein VFS91_03730, partial [Nitrobacter sp.]|nr:hypothetical protein [Nitrobacter sp.]
SPKSREGERQLTASDFFSWGQSDIQGKNPEAEIASNCCLFGRSGLFATRCSPVLQNINHKIWAARRSSGPRPALARHITLPAPCRRDGRSDGRRTDFQ